MNRLGLGLSSGLGLLCPASGIALFTQIGANGDYVGIIFARSCLRHVWGGPRRSHHWRLQPSVGLVPLSKGWPLVYRERRYRQAGGLGLAITVVVVAIPTALGHGATQISASEALVRLSGYHMGLRVALALAALGGLIALLGIKIRPEAPSNASHEDQ